MLTYKVNDLKPGEYMESGTLSDEGISLLERMLVDNVVAAVELKGVRIGLVSASVKVEVLEIISKEVG